MKTRKVEPVDLLQCAGYELLEQYGVDTDRDSSEAVMDKLSPLLKTDMELAHAIRVHLLHDRTRARLTDAAYVSFPVSVNKPIYAKYELAGRRGGWYLTKAWQNFLWFKIAVPVKTISYLEEQLLAVEANHTEPGPRRGPRFLATHTARLLLSKRDWKRTVHHLLQSLKARPKS